MIFRGHNCKVVAHRVAKTDECKYVYGIRHRNGLSGRPETVENGKVVVNFWGTLISDDPIDFNEAGGVVTEHDQYIKLTKDEKSEFSKELKKSI